MNPPSIPAPGHVDIWIARNGHSLDTLNLMEQTLAPEERHRSQAFKFDKHRNAYIFSHGVLRTILASYVRCPPAEIDFETNAFGKPSLRKPLPEKRLTFYMSHSGDLLL